MLSDLQKYDLRELCLAESWPEEQQAKLVVNFSILLSGYIQNELGDGIPPEADEEFKELLKDPELSVDDVLEFYQTKVSGLEEKLDQITLQLKKQFVLRYYKKELEYLKENPSDPAAAHVSAWEEIVNLAEQDDWDSVWEKLNSVKSNTAPSTSPADQTS